MYQGSSEAACLLREAIPILAPFLTTGDVLRIARVCRVLRDAVNGGSGRVLLNAVKWGRREPLPDDGMGMDLEGDCIPYLEAHVESASFGDLQRMANSSYLDVVRRLSFVEYWSHHLPGRYGNRDEDITIRLWHVGSHSIFFTRSLPRSPGQIRGCWGYATSDTLMERIIIQGLLATPTQSSVPFRVLSTPKSKGKVFAVAVGEDILFKLDVGRDPSKKLNPQQVTAILRWFVNLKGTQEEAATIAKIVGLSGWTHKKVEFAWSQAKSERRIV